MSENEFIENLETGNVELIQPALDSSEIENNARLSAQPMDSNFDGDCN